LIHVFLYLPALDAIFLRIMNLESDRFYHVFNRANGNEKLFVSDENYQFFLRQYELYISKYVNTYVYCLMPNHFHLLISIKSEKEIFRALNADKNLQGFAATARGTNLEGFHGSDKIERLLSFQFSRFLNSYAKSFNKMYLRRGSLFMKNFKRKLVTNDLYLKKLVHYIHNNPVESGLCGHPSKWKYSSYPQIVELNCTLIEARGVLEWFDDLENFKNFHKLSPQLSEVD